MIVTGLSREKIAEAISRDLPFGIWCADYPTRTITGYNKFSEILSLSTNEVPFDQLVELVREDYRSVLMLNLSALSGGAELELTVPTNDKWVYIKLTHYDNERQRAYGYVTECAFEGEKASNYDDVTSTFVREAELLDKVFDRLDKVQPREAINQILEDLRHTIGANRVSMVEYNKATSTQSCTFEAADYGIESRKNIISDIPLDNTQWLNAEMAKHRTLYQFYAHDLHGDKSAQLDVLFCQQNQTAVFVPLLHHDEVFGYLIIDFLRKKRDMSRAEQNMLKSLARIVSFCSHLAISTSRFVDDENLLHTIINVMPYGFVQLRYTYQTNGAPENLVLLRTNGRFLNTTGLNNIEGKPIDEALGQSALQILSMCNRVEKAGLKNLVSEQININGHNINVEMFMLNYNEFICLTTEECEATPRTSNLMLSESLSLVINEIHQQQHTHLTNIVANAKNLAAAIDESEKDKYMAVIKENAQSLLNTTANDATSNSQNAASTQGSSAANAASRQKILIAEDTESNYMLIQYILKNEYDLEWAHDGVEALEKYEANKPDLILMDVRMPRMSGITATSCIREKDTETPIIALTAFAFESDKQKTLEAGCTDFMSKPINTKMLREMIKKYLG